MTNPLAKKSTRLIVPSMSDAFALTFREAGAEKSAWSPGAVRATEGGLLLTILNVSNNPPSVALTAPGDQALFSAPASLNVSANASDIDGTISRVDFLASGFVIGTATNAPYTIAWTNVATG